MHEQFTSDFPYRDSGSRQIQLFLSFMNFQATILLHLLYTTYSGIKTLFLILNINYATSTISWYESCNSHM